MTDIPPIQKEGGVFFIKPPKEKKGTPSRSRVLKFVFITIGALVAFFVLAVAYEAFLSPSAASDREARKNYELAMNSLAKYEEAMRNDTYGGKTPRETLDLFISALESDDVELASRYFLLEESGERNPEIMEGLKRIKDENKISGLIKKLELINPYIEDISYEGDYKFASFDSNNNVDVYVNLEFNKYSGVWKIESM